jgi:hypothetical protein
MYKAKIEKNSINEKENFLVRSSQSNTPEKKFRAGAISATVWKNHGVKDGQISEYQTVTFERSYKDKEGNWQTTTTLRINDLPKAAVVLQKAYEELVLREFTDSAYGEESIKI